MKKIILKIIKTILLLLGLFLAQILITLFLMESTYGCVILFIGPKNISPSKVEIIENTENSTETIIFDGGSENYYTILFKAKYRKKDSLFYGYWEKDVGLTENIRTLEADASNMVLLNKKINEEVSREKYSIWPDDNIICYSRDGSYYGHKSRIPSLFTSYGNKFEIDANDLVDLYLDKEENIALINPEYEVLNYGTITMDVKNRDSYDYFYFVNKRNIYIYNSSSLELFKTIETDTDIYGVTFDREGRFVKGGKLLVALKDEKLFKIDEYIIIG